MLRRTEIDGQGATVAYLRNDWTPVDAGDEDMIKVTFDDGRVVFAYPSQALADYDPDEPRDERGRWTEGGQAISDPIGQLMVATEPPDRLAWAHEVEGRVKAQADADGYPARHIEVLNEPNANVLAGANYNTLAYYQPLTGKIRFFSDAMPREAEAGTANTVEGTAAHEIQHAKTDWWMKQNPSIERKLKDTIHFGGSWWKKPLGKGFATPEKLFQDDGVTPYSKATWQNWIESQDPLNPDRGLPFDLPFGETISEMRAVQRETGRLPGDPAWQEIYHDIENEWRHGHSKDLVGSELNPRVRPDRDVTVTQATRVPH